MKIFRTLAILTFGLVGLVKTGDAAPPLCADRCGPATLSYMCSCAGPATYYTTTCRECPQDWTWIES